jgi:hypothetical protein
VKERILTALAVREADAKTTKFFCREKWVQYIAADTLKDDRDVFEIAEVATVFVLPGGKRKARSRSPEEENPHP